MELTLQEIAVELEVMRLHPPCNAEEERWHTNLIIARNRLRMMELVDQGVFEGVREDGSPLPPAQVFSVAQLGEGATMAHVVVALGMFPSLSQARKNQWDKPLVLGVQELTKKKIRINIVP